MTGDTVTASGALPTGIEVTVPEGLITDSVLPTASATYTVPVRGDTAIPLGDWPTGIVAVTVRVRRLITDTVLLLAFATNASPVRGDTATASGNIPTGMVALTFPDRPSTTDTVLLSALSVYTYPVTGDTAIPRGPPPTPTVVPDGTPERYPAAWLAALADVASARLPTVSPPAATAAAATRGKKRLAILIVNVPFCAIASRVVRTYGGIARGYGGITSPMSMIAKTGSGSRLVVVTTDVRRPLPRPAGTRAPGTSPGAGVTVAEGRSLPAGTFNPRMAKTFSARKEIELWTCRLSS